MTHTPHAGHAAPDDGSRRPALWSSGMVLVAIAAAAIAGAAIAGAAAGYATAPSHPAPAVTVPPPVDGYDRSWIDAHRDGLACRVGPGPIGTTHVLSGDFGDRTICEQRLPDGSGFYQ